MIIIAILIMSVIWVDDLIERAKITKEHNSILDTVNAARSKHLDFMAQAERSNQ